MQASPKISVIIPCYNYGPYLKEALRSIQEQEFTDYEVIVVDDGSTDDTEQIVDSFSNFFGEKLHYIYQKRQGVYSARNKALGLVRGRLVAFLDADDIWFTNTLRNLNEFLDLQPDLAMVYANTEFFDDVTGKTLGKNFGAHSSKTPYSGSCVEELFTRGNFITLMASLVKIEVLREVGLFDDRLKVAGDYELWMRVACRHQIGYLDKILCRVRHHEKNLSFQGLRQAFAQIRITRRILSYCSMLTTRLGEERLKEKWQRVYYELGRALVLYHKPRRGRKFLKRVIGVLPRTFRNKAVVYYLISFCPGSWWKKTAYPR